MISSRIFFRVAFFDFFRGKKIEISGQQSLISSLLSYRAASSSNIDTLSNESVERFAKLLSDAVPVVVAHDTVQATPDPHEQIVTAYLC